MPFALLTLAIGGFGIGLTEFISMGLLPEVSADFGISETDAGLTSANVLGVPLDKFLGQAASLGYASEP